jgi:hypothetical protein
MKRGSISFAVLLKAQVNGREIAVGVGDAVDGEPALQGVATTPLTTPIEATCRRIVKRVAPKIVVGTCLKLTEGVWKLETSSPSLVSVNSEGEETTCCGCRMRARSGGTRSTA